MKHLKPYNENNIEWTSYFKFTEADEHLKESFIDFINPIDDRPEATVTHEKVGRDVMAFWIIKIPLRMNKKNIDNFSSEMTSILEEIKGSIGKAKTRLDIGHSVQIESEIKLSVVQSPNIKVTIWNNGKDR